MNTHRDFEDFLRLLSDQGVEYLIVGGYAVAFHGYVRATNDLDLFFRKTPANIARIGRALLCFGLPTTPAERERFSEPGNIIRMGVPPVRLEMINSISGVSFALAWRHRIEGLYGEVPVFYLSRADLLVNKLESGRPKDLADIAELGDSLHVPLPRPKRSRQCGRSVVR